MQTKIALRSHPTVAEAPIMELQHLDLANADRWSRNILNEIHDPRDVYSVLNQAISSVNRIGINPNARNTPPTRELIVDVERETKIIQSLPSAVTLIDIDQISVKEL